MAQAKIYKVRVWTSHTPIKGKDKGKVQIEDKKELIFVGKTNLNSAKHTYSSELTNLKHNEMYGYTVHAELFEPHIFNDGQLAYWPDKDQYIERYVTGKS